MLQKEGYERREVQKALFINDLNQTLIGVRFGCSQAFVSMALNYKENSKKARQIREYVKSLMLARAA